MLYIKKCVCVLISYGVVKIWAFLSFLVVNIIWPNFYIIIFVGFGILHFLFEWVGIHGTNSFVNMVFSRVNFFASTNRRHIVVWLIFCYSFSLFLFFFP